MKSVLNTIGTKLKFMNAYMYMHIEDIWWIFDMS